MERVTQETPPTISNPGGRVELHTFPDRQFDPIEQQFIAAAKKHQRDGEIEVDEDATIVSISDDGGAYVLGWIWVDNEEIGITSSDEDS